MTWNRTPTARGRLIAARLALTVGACAFLFSGCQNFQLPRIDPSGERIFLPPGAPAPISPYANTPYGTTPPYNPAIAPNQTPLPGTTVIAPPVLSAPTTPAPSALPSGVSSPMITSPLQTPPPVLAPATPPPMAPATSVPMMAPGLPAMPLATAPGMAAPALAPSGCSQLGVNLNPSRVVAPVGSEVVMVASLCGGEGYMITGERVEWMIGREGVGQFVSPGERGPFELWNRFRSLPRKVDNLYALNTTASQYARLDRGTQATFDDVEIQPGQAWVTVTSPVEGTTNITAFAPNVPEWDRRQQSASIYWVDAQWNFPPPAINPVGTRHTFVTSVSRQSDGSPIEGYLVRYEIVGGPDAAFAPEGNKAIEVPTNELGQASAEIYQTEPRAGTNQVNVQVIRPADANGGGRRFVMGAGSTLKSWTSSDIGVRVVGPAQATVGATISYRIEVTNPSGATAKNVVVTDAAPRNLTFVNSTPRGDSSPSGQEWRIGDVGPGQLKTVDAVYQLAQPGNFNYCASVTAEGGLTAKDCMTTSAAGSAASPSAPSPISIRVNGPQSAQVGSTVQYEIEVVNSGTTAATGLIVTDTFDAGLEHSVSASPIERDLKDLQPGQSQQFKVSFRVTRPGQLCQQIEVRGAGDVRSSTRSCLTATGATTPSPFDSGSGSVTEPDRPPRELDTTPPAEGGAVGARFTVRKTGPTRSRVGEEIVFTIEVTNTGDVTLNSIRIADNYETSLEPVGATDGYIISGGSLVWTVDALPPGKTVKRQIKCKCLQAVRSACNRVSVTAEGVSAVGDEACLEVSTGVGNNDDGDVPAIAPNPIRPDEPRFVPRAPTRGGIAPATGLTISIGEQTDPVRVGSETTYQVVISNKTDASDKQVTVAVRIPETMSMIGVDGLMRAKMLERSAQFEPIAELRAGESITFQVRVRADKPGSGRFEVDATSQKQRTPIRADEATQTVR